MEKTIEELKEEENKEVSQKKRKSRKIPKSIRPEEFKLIIQEIPKKDNLARISFLLAYASGLRISEVLRTEQEHFRDNKLFVPESKYGVERFVPIPKGWKDEFFKLLPLRKKLSIKSASRTLQRKFKKYSKKAKLPDYYTFHSLRHGFATRCLESGIPINQVQMLLGHSNVSTTSIYVKANPVDALKNYEDLF
jgi:integrase/recombinase XerD